MKRLMIAVVLMVVLMGAGVVEAGRHPTLQNPQGYRRGIGRGQHPTLQNPQGYRVGYYDYYGYGYDYGYSRGPVVVDYDYNYYPKNAQNSYPSGSLLSGLLGVPSYNEKQYWVYQNRILDLGEKQVQQSGSSHPHISDPQLLEQANQRGKSQKLKEENRKLQERIAELEKKINQLMATKAR